MGREFARVPVTRDALADLYLHRVYRKPRAEEFAHHGFLRRVNTLALCVQNVFAHLPPDLERVPDRETCKNAEINIQASVLTTFGAIDNLAWIWVTEKEITQEDGTPLRNNQVGLRKGNKIVWHSLPKTLRDSLNDMDEWFCKAPWGWAAFWPFL